MEGRHTGEGSWGRAPSWAVSQEEGSGAKGRETPANCTDGLGIFGAGAAGHELLLLSADQLLQHGLHDGHHHGGGRRVGEPHGQQRGTAHEA